MKTMTFTGFSMMNMTYKLSEALVIQKTLEDANIVLELTEAPSSEVAESYVSSLRTEWHKTVIPLNSSASSIISTYVYQVGLLNADYGYSTAVGFFNNVINIILLLSANAFSKKVLEESLF